MIDGDGALLLFNVTSATLRLSNLKLENGYGTVGGAIAGFSADVTCINCSFISNEASEAGGAIAVTGSNLSFQGETYCGQNRASGNGGFLVATASSLAFAGNSTFEDNVSLREGGVIYCDEGEVDFTGNGNFYNNAATRSGGGIWVHNTFLRFSGEESSVNFVNNSATALFGGAVTLTGQEPLQLDAGSVLFMNNSAPTGGAAYASGRAPDSIVDGAHFVSNSASLNGGAFVMDRIGGGEATEGEDQLKLINCIFEDNYAVGDGGAVVVSSGRVQINDTVFRNNVAGDLIERMDDCILSYCHQLLSCMMRGTPPNPAHAPKRFLKPSM